MDLPLIHDRNNVILDLLSAPNYGLAIPHSSVLNEKLQLLML